MIRAAVIVLLAMLVASVLAWWFVMRQGLHHQPPFGGYVSARSDT